MDTGTQPHEVAPGGSATHAAKLGEAAVLPAACLGPLFGARTSPAAQSKRAQQFSDAGMIPPFESASTGMCPTMRPDGWEPPQSTNPNIVKLADVVNGCIQITNAVHAATANVINTMDFLLQQSRTIREKVDEMEQHNGVGDGSAQRPRSRVRTPPRRRGKFVLRPVPKRSARRAIWAQG